MFDPPAARTRALTQADLPPLPLWSPDTLADAIAALRHAPSPAAIYAGGTDFFAQVREGASPASLIWIDGIAALRQVRATPATLTLGALLTHHQVMALPELDAIPGLAAAWGRIATVRIRRQATLGGNLMARRARYELSILLDALGATAHLIGPDGARDLPVGDIWTADLSGTPLLACVSIPLEGAPRLDYERSMRPTFTQALCLRDDGLRLSLATEWQRPWTTDAARGDDPAAVLSALPADFHDPGVGHAHLEQVGAVFLARQITRLEALQ
ncbi:xanthine dehydrogenase family protein subunit M [Jannaschia sp. 2305UL9-9]|uniref:FAD binding domain-containing protein n=1 Tax=Jannaschia sp. 2305UL9-9 TaxID=3121638 RepID=UPI00352891C6